MTAGETAGEGKQLDLSAADGVKNKRGTKSKSTNRGRAGVLVCTKKHTDLNTQGGWRAGSLEPSR